MQNIMYKFLLGVLILLLLLLISACGNIVRLDSSICGRIIDKETNEPISGVVVIADWEKVSHSANGVTEHAVYGITETISNGTGEFCLKGCGLVFFVEEPSIEIFKAGYSNIADRYLPNLRNSSLYTNGVIKWEGDKFSVFLNKLSIEERSERYRGVSKFDNYIDKGILSNPNDGNRINDVVKRGRQQFDSELKKEIVEVKQYRDQMDLKPGSRIQRREGEPAGSESDYSILHPPRYPRKIGQ